MELADKYAGFDNYRRPKMDYIRKLEACSDEELSKECNQYIWLSAFATNNPLSDFHWKCDACYDECKRRDRIDIYTAAHKRQSAR